MNRHIGAIYVCNICGANLKSPDALRTHMQAKHEPKAAFICGVCEASFRHRGPYNDHIAGHLDPAVKRCDLCNVAYDNRRSAIAHKKRKHPELKNLSVMPKIDPSNPALMEIVKKLKNGNDRRRANAKLNRSGGKPNFLEAALAKVNNTETKNGMIETEYVDLEVLEEYENEVFPQPDDEDALISEIEVHTEFKKEPQLDIEATSDEEEEVKEEPFIEIVVSGGTTTFNNGEEPDYDNLFL